ncbi:MAG: hypothetical protein WCE65_08815 [Methanoregula sp.]
MKVDPSRASMGCWIESHLSNIKYYIKKIIYISKKVVCNIFGWKIVIEDINEIPPEVFVNTIANLAHDRYKEKRTSVFRWKAMKLVYDIANDTGYTKLSFGCYKYGWYSFKTDNILLDIFNGRSLHGAKIDRKKVNFDLIDLFTPLIDGYEKIFAKKQYKGFLNYAHVKKIPEEFQALYDCHDKFRLKMKKINECEKITIPEFYDPLSELISNFDSNLKHVNEEHLCFYFDYMDLLEGVLLVCKNRNTNFRNVKDILSEFKEIYDNEISSFLFPFLSTVKWDNIEYELDAYKVNIQRKSEKFPNVFKNLKDKAKKYNLIPTLEDMDLEIEKSLDRMNNDEKKELFALLKSC